MEYWVGNPTLHYSSTPVFFMADRIRFIYKAT